MSQLDAELPVESALIALELPASPPDRGEDLP